MRTILPDQFEPQVQVANYLDVSIGSKWGPRTLEDIELILIVRGRFSYRDTSGKYTLHAGDVLRIEPDVEHVLVCQGRQQATFSCIHCEPVRGLRYAEKTYRLQPAPLPVTHTAGDRILRSLFEQAARTFSGAGPYHGELIPTLVRAIWIRLSEYWHTHQRPRISERVGKMAEFLRQRYRDPVGRLDLARRFGLTPQYVNALFQKELGVTPVEFLQRERIQRAEKLLRKGTRVKDAAEAVGFGDAFYFSKIFKRIHGLPPSRIT